MPPTPSSPTAKLMSTQRTSSQDSTDGIRKRVCKACDRCRLKKSKCDGSSPCLRCKADNAICVFGERKKSHDKVYPKGYVEMLEQQQAQLVQGLQEMYRRLRCGHAWDGELLHESNGHPLTHDILAALNLVNSKHDDVFEEDVSKLQTRLIAAGQGYTQVRRGSVSSDSEHSQHGTSTPVLSRPNTFFQNSSHFDSASVPPMVQSPLPQQQSHVGIQRSSLTTTTFQNDPSLYAPEWVQALSDAMASQQKSQFAVTQTQSPLSMDDLEVASERWAAGFSFDGMFNVPQYSDAQGLTTMDGMDGVDFSKFVNPTASTMDVFQ